MASTVASIPIQVRFPDGVVRPLISGSVKVVRPAAYPAAATVITTVSTNASGIFPATAVSDAVGTQLLLSVASYYEMGGTILVTTI